MNVTIQRNDMQKKTQYKLIDSTPICWIYSEFQKSIFSQGSFTEIKGEPTEILELVH